MHKHAEMMLRTLSQMKEIDDFLAERGVVATDVHRDKGCLNIEQFHHAIELPDGLSSLSWSVYEDGPSPKSELAKRNGRRWDWYIIVCLTIDDVCLFFLSYRPVTGRWDTSWAFEGNVGVTVHEDAHLI